MRRFQEYSRPSRVDFLRTSSAAVGFFIRSRWAIFVRRANEFLSLSSFVAIAVDILLTVGRSVLSSNDGRPLNMSSRSKNSTFCGHPSQIDRRSTPEWRSDDAEPGSISMPKVMLGVHEILHVDLCVAYNIVKAFNNFYDYAVARSIPRYHKYESRIESQKSILRKRYDHTNNYIEFESAWKFTRICKHFKPYSK